MKSPTEHRQVEKALHKSEGKFRTISFTATDAIILIDNPGNIFYWNSTAERIFGYSSKEVIGNNIEIIIPPRYIEAHKKAFNRYIEKGQCTSIEKIYVTSAVKKDGTEIPVELSISAVQLNDKWYLMGIIRDISEHKRLESQVMYLNKMGTIGQLARGVVHDFNNILTAIIGYGNLLKMMLKEDNPLQHNVNKILALTERATDLTQHLLAFSREQIINPKPVNLNEIIRRVAKLLLSLIGEDIELKIVLKGSDLTVIADSRQIEQALINLAINARDAMPDGGLLTIETELVEMDSDYIKTLGYGRPGMYALISVADTGIGVDEDTRAKIFELLFNTKENGKGTGLGISVVYGIIKQHNGYIDVCSESGKGTTFNIYLPIVKLSVEEIKSTDIIAPIGGTETILVAEDEPNVREVIKTVLEEFGYKVIEAVDGKDAIEKFMENKDRVQLILLDVVMPKKSGKEAYIEIRKIRPNIKAIFISGYEKDVVHKKGIWEKELNLLSKPISPQELLKKVKGVLVE